MRSAMYCTTKMPSWRSPEKMHQEQGAMFPPLALPSSSSGLLLFSLGWQQAAGRDWLPPSPFPLMNFLQLWKMSPSGKLASKSIERYFHAQPLLESSSSPVYLIKLDFNLKFMNNNNKKKRWRKREGDSIAGIWFGNPCLCIKEKAKVVVHCIDLRSMQVEMPMAWKPQLPL